MMTNGFNVRYIPIDYYARLGKSKIRPIKTTLDFLQLIAKIALYFAPLKVFMPLSLGLILLAIAWGLFTYFYFGRLADLSTLLIVLTGLQTAVIGLLAELIHWRMPLSYEKPDSTQ